MEVQNVSNNQKCFVSMLSRLRESSKEAVVSSDADFNDPYTMYMHVDRPVQDWYLLKQKLIITNMKIFQVWLERFRKLCLVLIYVLMKNV